MSAVEGGNKAVVEVLLDLETSHLCDTNAQEKVLFLFNDLIVTDNSDPNVIQTGVWMDCSTLCC